MTREDTGATINEKVRKEYGHIAEDSKLHMMYVSSWGDLKQKVTQKEDYKDMSDSDMVAFEYTSMNQEEQNDTRLIEVKFSAKVKSYNYVSLKDIAPPKWVFSKVKKITCRDFKI